MNSVLTPTCDAVSRVDWRRNYIRLSSFIGVYRYDANNAGC